jgi:hypothetical protein
LCANLRALKTNWTRPIESEFVFGRDGYLTLRGATGAWHTGCSLPHRAAQAMLKKMTVTGRVACFLGPTHAAHLRVALDRLRFDQAIIAIMPDARDFEMALHCDDFSSEIESHRLFLATGENWIDELARIFENHPGLAPPSHFVRLPLLDESQCDAMMRDAQKVFSQLASRRAEQVKSIWRERKATNSERAKICLIASSAFRLWDDAGNVLESLFRVASNVVRLDPDDPASTSPVAVAQAVAKADVILSANMYRGDALAASVPEEIAWITWVTNARLPSVNSAGPRDRLIVIDEGQKERAIASGWKDSRIDVAGWPMTSLADPLSREAAVICDVPSLECPEALAEFSSFKLLWDSICEQLPQDPTVLHDIEDYLTKLRRKLSIGEEGFPRNTFIEGCILPAWRIGSVKALLRAGAPLRIYGRGWEIDQSRGPIETREQFQSAIAHASCLIDLWPAHVPTHPIHFTSRPVLSLFDKSLMEKGVGSLFSRKDSRPLFVGTPITRERLERIVSM